VTRCSSVRYVSISPAVSLVSCRNCSASGSIRRAHCATSSGVGAWSDRIVSRYQFTSPCSSPRFVSSHPGNFAFSRSLVAMT